MKRGRILVVDDDPSMCSMLEADLARQGFSVLAQTSAADALDAVARRDFDVVLTDLKMPGMDGIELCQRIVASRPDVPVIVETAFGSMETAVSALRAGAYDFVAKPVDPDALAFALDRAVQHRRLQEKVAQLNRAVEESKRFDELLGASGPMKRLFDLLGRVAEGDSSVLVTGESGTGKELVARALHNNSGRSGGPFVAINCAAVPEALLEGELFGHASGAFTGAQKARKGLFVQADGGTLFLDEITEMPVALQPKLLRALEQRMVRPIGQSSETPFDVRLITATNRDLESAVESGRFREDLFYRINVIAMDVPPLRARGTDILLLSQHFVEKFAGAGGKRIEGLDPGAAKRLMAYPWPGNVRELRNVIERAVALTQYDRIVEGDLPDKILENKTSPSPVVVDGGDPSELTSMEEVERRYIQHVLQAVGGNKTTAARILGFDRKTLYRKLDRYDIEVDSQ